MKIRAIKAGQFQGYSDLEVQGLQDGLNVIQMPSWESVDEIHECVVSTLLPIDDELCRTALELQAGDQSFQLDGINSLGEITAKRLYSDSQDITRLTEHLAQFPAPVFELLFTDQSDLQGYADQWKKLGLISRILESDPDLPEQENLADPQFVTGLDEQTRILNRIIRDESNAESPDTTSFITELADRHREKKEASDRKHELEHRSAKLQSEQKNLESALGVLELWRQRESLDDDATLMSQLELLEESKIEIGSIDRQIQKIRARIEKTKQQVEKKKQPKASPIDKLLEDEDKAFRAEEQLEHLRYQIRANSESPTTSPDISKRSSRELLLRLQPFAVAVKHARAELLLKKQESPAEPHESESQQESDDFLSGIAIADLQKRVDILNSECTRLRRPIELSANLSFGLFAVVILAGLLICVGMLYPGRAASPWLIGGGVAAITSCLILWTSLRRPSTEQIRYYRLEIKRLVDEIQRIQDDSGEKFSVLIQMPNSPIGRAQRQLQTAKTEWQNALRSEGLPDDLTPRQLLRRLKETRRFDSQHFDQPSFDPELEQLRFELASNNDWLTNWKSRLLVLLESDSEPSDVSVDELLRAARQMRESVKKSGEKQTSLERLTKCQKQLKRLKEKRLGHLEQCGCESLKDLRQQLVVLQERAETDHRKEDLSKEINRFLSNCENPNLIRSKIKEGDEDALHRENTLLEEQFVRVQAEIAELDRKMRDLDKSISRLVSESTTAHASLEKGIRQERRTFHQKKLLCYLILSNRDRTVHEEVPLGLQYATEFFRRTTDWPDAEITFCQTQGDFLVSKTPGQQKALADLSQSVQKQAAICIQLAMAKILGDREGTMPFVCVGHWVTPGGRFTEATTELLIELSEQHMQFVMIVGDDHAAQLFRDFDQPVLVVDLKQETVVYEVESDDPRAGAYLSANHDSHAERGLVDLKSI